MQQTLNTRRAWPLDMQGERSLSARPLPVIPTHDDLRAMRVDLPCREAGLSAPPCSLQAWFMASGDGHRLLVLCPPGRAQRAAQWLAQQGVPDATVEPGIAPRSLWAHLAALPTGWQRFLLDRAVHRIEMTPEGTASLFIEDTVARAHGLIERIQQAAPAARARDALTADPGEILTSRQKEVLAVAVASGYYDVPRRITLRGLAQTMGLSPGAASELLRRGERTLVGSFFDSGAASAWAWDTTEE